MAAPLDLDPEWGAIDLLEEIEQTFGIRITNEEAERCRTVGDLHALIRAHAPDWDTQRGDCASSAIFYELRRAIAPAHRHDIAPGTSLAALDGKHPHALTRRITRATSLRLPVLAGTWRSGLAAVLIVLGLIAAIVSGAEGAWRMAPAALTIFAIAGAILYHDPARWPAGIETVGDLVRRTVALNTPRLRAAGKRPPGSWTILTALAADHGVLAPAQIARDTPLHK